MTSSDIARQPDQENGVSFERMRVNRPTEIEHPPISVSPHVAFLFQEAEMGAVSIQAYDEFSGGALTWIKGRKA
jgi:hypothetical protein